MKKKIGILFSLCIMLFGLVTLNAKAYDGTTFYNDFFYDNIDDMRRADWANGGAFGCIYEKNNIVFENGIMKLILDKSETEGYEFSSGAYRTRNTFGYGRYDVRMKPAKNDGIVSSFFTYTGPAHGTQWDEIDIEFLGKNTTMVQFNFFADGVGKHEYKYNLGYDASKEFHEYGFEWLENSITWFVDGKAVHKVTSSQYELPCTPSKIMMNLWNGNQDRKDIVAWLNPYDGKTPLVAEYDYIKYTKIDESGRITSEPIQVETPVATSMATSMATVTPTAKVTLKPIITAKPTKSVQKTKKVKKKKQKLKNKKNKRVKE